MIEITSLPVAAQPVIDSAGKSSNGAVVTFIGTVRDNSEGKRVLYLEYEAFPEMAEKELLKICGEIRDRWGIGDISIVHRVGKLEIGDVAVVIAVGAGHRAEAFQACQYAIDRIKETVPIWKKEYYENGSKWVEHP